MRDLTINTDKKYKVHHYDNFYQKYSYNHHRGTHFFDTLEEAEAFEKERNEACKKYGFTDYYVLEDTTKSNTIKARF